MKVALTISYFLIGILGFFVWRNYMEVQRLEALIPPVPPKPAPTPTPEENSPSADTTTMTKRTSVTGGELWDKMREQLKEVKLDLTFQNEPK